MPNYLKIKKNKTKIKQTKICTYKKMSGIIIILHENFECKLYIFFVIFSLKLYVYVFSVHIM